MFEAVRTNKRVVQAILALVTLSFAFFGIESYLRNSTQDTDVAKVGGTSISRVELDRALRDQQERIRNANGGNVDDAVFRSAEFLQATLNNLINQRVLAIHAAKNHLTAGDRQLQETIAAVPAFSNDGHFDVARYESVLRAQGMSKPLFEARLRQDLAIQQVIGPVGEGALASRRATLALLKTQLEQREIQLQEIEPASFLAKVTVSDAAIKDFYDSNPGLFERPARVRAEYVVLDGATAEKEIQVTDKEVRAWYDDHQDKYVTAEERRASHILIQIPADATEGDKAKAKATIDGLYAKVKADPASFARLAKEFSQDPGSSGSDGDLGYFGHGVMVKPFEDAVFALKTPGEATGPIRTEFGLHLIKLTDIKPSKGRAFDEVASEIRNELVKQGANKRFAEMAEMFSNMVYEQADSLTPVAEHFKLKIAQSDWIAKGSDQLGSYKSTKLVDALFSDDAVANHRNTDTVDVGGGTLVAARVVNHEPARRLRIEEAKAQISSLLRTREASKLAVEEGKARLDALRKGENSLGTWSEPRMVQRGPNLPHEMMKTVFSAPPDKLPSFSGVPTQNGGYALIKLTKVVGVDVNENDPRLESAQSQYQQLLGRLELSGYLAQLRSRYGVEISPTALKGSGE